MRLRKSNLEQGAPELELLGAYIPKELKEWFKAFALQQQRTMSQQLECMLLSLKRERESRGNSE